MLATTVVPRQPEVLSGHSGESVQFVAASRQRRTSIEVFAKRKYPRLMGSVATVAPQ